MKFTSQTSIIDIFLFLLQKYGYLPRLNSIYHNINVITKSPLHGHYVWIASQ